MVAGPGSSPNVTWTGGLESSRPRIHTCATPAVALMYAIRSPVGREAGCPAGPLGRRNQAWPSDRGSRGRIRPPDVQRQSETPTYQPRREPTPCVCLARRTSLPNEDRGRARMGSPSKIPPEIRCEFRRGRIASFRLLVERFQDDRLQIAVEGRDPALRGGIGSSVRIALGTSCSLFSANGRVSVRISYSVTPRL